MPEQKAIVEKRLYSLQQGDRARWTLLQNTLNQQSEERDQKAAEVLYTALTACSTQTLG